MTTAPAAVEVWRGDRVESRHRVRACVLDARGGVVLAAGDIDEPVYPRSAIKPFQALALIESGAADAFAVDDAELALACASHGGEPDHVALVEGWLHRLGLDETALACGPHPPLHPGSAATLVQAGAAPRRVHNNCSGKHTGMLAATLQIGAPTAGYEGLEHPVQRYCAGAIAELAGCDRLPPPGIDGCCLPNHPLPLRALARAAARLADPAACGPKRRNALARIGRAMRTHPRMVAGTGRCCTALMECLPGVIAKTGAEGAYLAALPAHGYGIALKVEDGATRAAEVALLALLEHLLGTGAVAVPALGRFRMPQLRNTAGTVVGHIAPVAGWPA
ncbi:MAG: asparaginase [Geminicoccaceae bacterium]